MWTIPTPSPIEAVNRIYVFELGAVNSNNVYLWEPTQQSTKIYAIQEQEAARDEANIIIQLITQDYFQKNILKFVPAEYRKFDIRDTTEGGGGHSLDAYLNVFAITLDEIKEAIDNFPLIFDIDHCPSRYLKVIADLLNYPLESTDNTAEQRRQLKTAIAWYKSKGSRKAFEAVLYAFGFHADVAPLWTEDYDTFHETIPGVARGADPPNDYPLLIENGGTWYRSPHFGIWLRAIVGDQHVWIEWNSVPQSLQDEYYVLAEEIGYHKAFYQMWDELHDAGASLHYYFTVEDFDYIWRRLEFLRPIFAVLDWLAFRIEQQEHYEIDTIEAYTTVNPVREEKGWYLGYCDLDDAVYTRLDERLLGQNPGSLTSPLTGGAPGSTTVTDEVVDSVSGVISGASGTLANQWIFTGITFEVMISSSAVEITDNDEGVLTGPDGSGISGFINYLTGEWNLLFEGTPPDNGTDITADYVYTDDVPPTDRSGAFPRGSTELPFPHLRDPQPGYCHPPEDLYIDWYGTFPDLYHLPLTRDGLGLYPSFGPVGYIDHADFPSRGFTDASLQPGHANTFTRELGYAERPLSILEVINSPEEVLFIDTFTAFNDAGYTVPDYTIDGDPVTVVVNNDENKLSIIGGKLNCDGGSTSPSYGLQGVWWTKNGGNLLELGDVVFITYEPLSGTACLGTDTSTSGPAGTPFIWVVGNKLLINRPLDDPEVADFTYGVDHQLCCLNLGVSLIGFYNQSTIDISWVDAHNTLRALPCISNYNAEFNVTEVKAVRYHNIPYDIFANEILRTPTPSNGTSYDVGAIDREVTCVFNPDASLSKQDVFVAYGDANNHVKVWSDDSSDAIKIYEIVGGVGAELASYASARTASTPLNIKAELLNGVIRVWADNVELTGGGVTCSGPTIRNNNYVQTSWSGTSTITDLVVTGTDLGPFLDRKVYPTDTDTFTTTEDCWIIVHNITLPPSSSESVCIGGDQSSGNSLRLYVDNTGLLRVYSYVDGSYSSTFISVASAVADGDTLTIKKDGDNIKVYNNGDLLADGTNPDGVVPDSTELLKWQTSSTPAWFEDIYAISKEIDLSTI